jgi:acyl carrier protein
MAFPSEAGFRAGLCDSLPRTGLIMDQQTKIVEIIRRIAGRPVDPAPEQSLFESGLLDSFTLTDMIGALESEFSIRIPDSDLKPRKFDSVANIQRYLESRS